MATDHPGDPEPIPTRRLTLESMTVPFMEALAAGDLGAAEREIDARVTPWLPVQLDHFLQYRLAQLRVDPSVRGWLGRAIVLAGPEGRREVIGSIGFHGPPDELGRLEVGYSIDPGFRRRGYAIEAVRAMLDWAMQRHGVRRFIASVRPDNEPSLGLIRQLGFRQVGEQMDEIDGPELVFEADWPPA